MPALGVTQQTGTLLKWLKGEGDPVSQGEPLMSIETDKASVEIEAPASGILAGVSAAPGDRIPVGSRIALILAPEESTGAPNDFDTKVALPGARGEMSSADSKGEIRAIATSPATSSSASVAARSEPSCLLASPAAKRLARERGIDLATVGGSGPEGAIRSRDVLAAAEDGTLPQRAAPVETTRPLSAMRRIVAERMARSKREAPHFYLNVDVDMSAAMQQRADWQAAGKPSTNDCIIYVCARALKAFPSLNASFSPQGVRLYGDIHIGVAVAVDDGLVVPVIHHADRWTLSELAAQSRRVIAQARTQKLLPRSYEGATFTVSNLGMFGVDSFVAIINPPQAGILAVGRIEERVVARNGMFAIRPMMTITVSADHRAVDGATAARFLEKVKTGLERAEF